MIDHKRQSLRRFGRGDAQQPDLGRGIEAEPEEHAQRIHVPTAPDHGEHGPEEARQKSAAGEQDVEILVDIRSAVAHAHKRAINGRQDNDVDDGNAEQKQSRDQRADDAAHHARPVHAVLQGKRGRGNGRRAQHHDGRVPQRKHEAYRDRPLSLLHQLARHVVDGGNVIGIDRVAQAEAVGQQRRAQQQRIMAKRHDRPQPGRHVERKENPVDADDLAAQVGRSVVEKSPQNAHRPRTAAFPVKRRAGLGKVTNEPILPF